LSDLSSEPIVAVKYRIVEAGDADAEALLRELNKTVIEQVLETEIDHHLGYEKHDPAGDGSGNTRNGTRSKTVKRIVGDVTIDVPRDRNGTFSPTVVRPYQRRLSGFDDMEESLELGEEALNVAKAFLKNKGNLVIKIFESGDTAQFIKRLKSCFKIVKRFSPEATRKQSREFYVICKEYVKHINN